MTADRTQLSPPSLRKLFGIPEPPPQAASWINDIRTADVIVQIKPSHQTLYLHKAVLAAGSAFFEAAFKSGFKDATSGFLTLDIMASDIAIHACIQFMYDEARRIDPKDNPKGPRLVQSVEFVARSDTIGVLRCADYLGMPSLAEVCHKCFSSQWRRIVEATGFKSENVPQHLLEEMLPLIPQENGVYWRVWIILHWGATHKDPRALRALILTFAVPLRTDEDYLTGKDAEEFNWSFGARAESVLTLPLLAKLVRQT